MANNRARMPTGHKGLGAFKGAARRGTSGLRVDSSEKGDDENRRDLRDLT